MNGTKRFSVLHLSVGGQHLLLLCLCFAAYTVAYIGRLNYSACLAQIIADCGFSRAAGGMVGTAFFIVYGCCQLLTGFAGDFIAPERMIFAGLAGAGVVNLCFSFTASAPVMTALWCANGFFQAMLWSPIVRIFAEWFKPAYRRAACVRISITSPVGTVAAYLSAVFFIHRGDWRGQFRFAAVLLLAMAGVWAAFLRPLAASAAFETRAPKSPKMPPQPRPGPSMGGAGILPLLLRAGLPVFFLALVAQGVLKEGITTWVPTFAEDTYGLDGGVSVFGTMFLPLVNIAGVYLAAWLDRRVFRNELRCTGALFALNTCLILLLYALRGAGALPAYLLLALATTTMMGANTMLASYMPLSFARFGKSSSAAGILNFCIYLGCGVSVWGTGLLSTALGWGNTMLLWAVISAAGLCACLAAGGGWNRFKERIAAEK